MASPTAAATTPWRMLFALAGSLALHAILLAGLNFRPLPDVAFDDVNVIRQLPLAVVLRPPTPLAAAPKAGPAASRAEPKTSTMLPPRVEIRSDRPAPPAMAEQAVQTPVLPRFDLDFLRQQARAQDQGKRKESPVAPQNLGRVLPAPALEQDTPLSRSIAKAKRPDCKTTHSRWGLLAIPLLIYDTATESGCQW